VEVLGNMRLQVFLSHSGIASRRAAKNIISSGRIKVNNKKVYTASFKIDPEKDSVFLDKKRLFPRQKIYIMLHKSKGVTTTKHDPFAEKTVMDCLPSKFRHLNPVGRLDRDTTGLLILTNDGELINTLTHPRFEIEKLYRTLLDKKLKLTDKIEIEKGIVLEGRITLPCKIELKKGSSLEITMREGRKRQIKRMFGKIGYRVVDLKRLKEGSLGLGSLGEGRWRFLTKEEMSNLNSEL